MKIHRRHLLVGAAGALSAWGVIALGRQFVPWSRAKYGFTQADAEFLIGGAFQLEITQGLNQPHQLDAQTSKRRAFRMNLRTGQYEELTSTAPIDVLEANPQDSNVTLGCSRGGRLLSMLDWKLGREAKSMKLPEHRSWYGHLAFSDDGRYAILPMAEHQQKIKAVYEEQVDPNAWLAILDLENWKIIDEIPTQEGRLHDLARADRDVFVGLSASHDRSPTLQIFDLRSRRVEARTLHQANGEKLQATQRSNPGHLRVMGGLVYFVLSGQMEKPLEADGLWVGVNWRRSQISQAQNSRAEILGEGPTRLQQSGELLSVDVDEASGQLWITAPDRKQILIWNLADQRLVKTLEFPESPRSIQVLPEHDLALVGTFRELRALDLRDYSERGDISRRWKDWGPRPFYHSHTRVTRA
jgi:hypothetical protein